MIKNKTKFKLSAYRLVIGIMALAVVASIGGFYAVKAFSGTSPKVIVEGDYIEAPEPVAEAPTLGAGGWSPATVSNEECINDDCAFYLTSKIYDTASTTIASFADPFITATSTYTAWSPILKGDTSFGYVGATSTVEYVRLVTTGVATSTYNLQCGASATKYYDSALNPVIFYATNITTSSLAYLDSRATSTSSGLGFVGNTDAGVIVLTPQKPYLLCQVTTDSVAQQNAFTNVSRTFKGVIQTKISRPNF